MAIDLNKETIREIAESFTDRIWNKYDQEAIDEYVHPDIIIHSLLGNFHGIDSMRQVFQVWLKAFPNLQMTNFTTICEENRVAIQWEATGNHSGDFKGIKATHKRISYPGIFVYHFVDNMIMEYWSYVDVSHIILQIKTP